MTKVHVLIVTLFAIFMNGCGYFLSNQSMSQAQIKNFETRTVPGSFDSVYSAATEALFDLGYIIKHSERESGLLMGEKTQSERVWVSASQGKPGEYVTKQRIYNLTLLIKKEDKSSTNVRAKTSVDGESKLNKQMVDQVWVYVDRQTMLEAPAPITTISKNSAKHTKRK